MPRSAKDSGWDPAPRDDPDASRTPVDIPTDPARPRSQIKASVTVPFVRDLIDPFLTNFAPCLTRASPPSGAGLSSPAQGRGALTLVPSNHLKLEGPGVSWSPGLQYGLVPCAQAVPLNRYNPHHPPRERGV